MPVAGQTQSETTAEGVQNLLVAALSLPGVAALFSATILLSIQDPHTYRGISKLPALAGFCTFAGFVGLGATPLALLITLVRQSKTHPLALLLLLGAFLGEVACTVAGKSGHLGLLWSPVG